MVIASRFFLCAILVCANISISEKNNTIRLAFLTLVTSGFAAAAANPIQAISFVKKIGKIGYKSYFFVRYGKSADAVREQMSAEFMLQAQKDAEEKRDALRIEQQKQYEQQNTQLMKYAENQAGVVVQNARLEEQLKAAQERLRFAEDAARTSYEKVVSLEQANVQLMKQLWHAQGLLQQSKVFLSIASFEKQHQASVKSFVAQLEGCSQSRVGATIPAARLLPASPQQTQLFVVKNF